VKGKQGELMSCKSILTVFVLSVLLSLSGCASIVDKDAQKVEITTVPANCFITIKEKDGKPVYSGQTPFKQELNKAKGYFSGQVYDVHIERGGYRPVDLVIKSKNNIWYVFGNTINAFIPGWIGVDAKTETMYELSEPKLEIHLIFDRETGFPGQDKEEKDMNK
jgi:hypothetical protein